MDKGVLRSICISPSCTVREVIQQLNNTNQKILLVVGEGETLLGTISDGDVRRSLLRGVGFNEAASEIMRKEYTALSVDTPDLKRRAKQLMLEKVIAHIPVLDQQGRIYDIIQWTDFLENGQEKKSPPLQDNAVVIMAGGQGSRLNLFTKVFPKPLIPIGDRPAVEVIMERFYQCGFHRFIYTLNYKKEYVKLFLKERTFPYEIEWVEEDEFLGTAGSLALLKDKLPGTFFVVNCDTLLSVNFNEVLEWHREHEALITVVGSHNEVNIPFGVLALSNGRLDAIREKPIHDVIINTGMYVMEPRILEYIAAGVALDMNELINTVAAREKVNVFPVYGRDWIDIGQWEEYQKGIKYLQG